MIVYRELSGPFEHIKEATYKGVKASIGEGGDWVSIYTIESSNKRQGEVNEFINLLKQDYPKKRLCSSVPLNDLWDYIVHKHGIEHPEGS